MCIEQLVCQMLHSVASLVISFKLYETVSLDVCGSEVF